MCLKRIGERYQWRYFLVVISSYNRTYQKFQWAHTAQFLLGFANMQWEDERGNLEGICRYQKAGVPKAFSDLFLKKEKSFTTPKDYALLDKTSMVW